MPVQVAFIRAINVAGHNALKMADLRELLEALGFEKARSILQSGNLLFEGDRRSGETLEKLLEAETAKRLKVSVDYLVRSEKELRSVVSRNPFEQEAKDDPAHLVVMFLKEPAGKAAVEALRESITGREDVQADGRQLYIVYPDGIGRSKLTGTSIEKKLGTRGTARNWNTLLKLLAACE